LGLHRKIVGDSGIGSRRRGLGCGGEPDVVGLPIVVLGTVITTRGRAGDGVVVARVLSGNADGLGRKLATVTRSR
jgi:hypothetical protein